MVDENSMHETSAKFQYFGAFVVNLLTLGIGINSGWASPNIVLLTSNESPLPSGKISMDEASWVASLLCVGALIGNLFFGFVTSKFGRKYPLIFITIPAIISWLLILFAQNENYLYASRLLSGFICGGILIIVPLFLSEIADDRIRGFLGSWMVLISNSGILLAFIFGSYLDFYTTPKIVIAITVVCAVALFFFPESPSFLVQQNKITNAENSIRFYRNLSTSDKDYELIKSEVNKLKSALGDIDKNKCEENSMKWSDISSRPGRKAMIIGIVLIVLNQFCGCFAILQYTGTIFEEADSSISANDSSIIVGAIQLFGSYIATLLVDRAGRKILFVISSTGTALGLIVFGIYFKLKSNGVEVDALSWIPIASFSFVIFIASLAVLSLPFLVISEILPEKIKNFGASFCMALLWSSAFLIVKCMPLLNDILGINGTLFIFAAICLLGAVFIIFYMPETKGKSYDEIMKSLE